MKLLGDLLFIAIGGALGAVSRYGISEWMRIGFGKSFPLGTLLANLLGCFLMGIWIGSGLAESHPRVRLGLAVGFLGSLTTFSTFSAESVQQIERGEYAAFTVNATLSLIAGLLLFFAGAWLTNRFSSGI